MLDERKIEILMKDNCTKAEANEYLKKGTIIFEDFETYFEDYMEEWNIEKEDIPKYRKMIEEKTPVEGWGIVEDNGKTYYIWYEL